MSSSEVINNPLDVLGKVWAQSKSESVNPIEKQKWEEVVGQKIAEYVAGKVAEDIAKEEEIKERIRRAVIDKYYEAGKNLLFPCAIGLAASMLPMSNFGRLAVLLGGVTAAHFMAKAVAFENLSERRQVWGWTKEKPPKEKIPVEYEIAEKVADVTGSWIGKIVVGLLAMKGIEVVASVVGKGASIYRSYRV